MKRLFAPLLSAMLVILILHCAGCARQQHYIETENDTLCFFYRDVDAEQILFVSSLDKYQPHPARQIDKGVWKVTVPLAHEFDYFYLVDGVPTVPECAYTVSDDFGGKNCLYVHGLL